MIKPEVVLRLLESLREHVNLLRSVQSETLSGLTSDLLRYNGVIHLLQLCIEHVTDIGAHILAGSGLEMPDEYREIILKLGQHSIIPREFAERIAPMAGFRNIVVHRYLTVDPAQVYAYLKHGLDDFERFILYIYEYLRRTGYIQ